MLARLMALLLLCPLNTSADDDEDPDPPKFPKCVNCRKAQTVYNKALTSYNDAESIRDTAIENMETARIAKEEAAAKLRSDTAARDSALTEVRNTKVKTDKNPTYIDAVKRQSDAVDKVADARQDYDAAAEKLMGKSKQAIDTSADALKKADAVHDANGNVSAAVNDAKNNPKPDTNEITPEDKKALISQDEDTGEIIEDATKSQQHANKAAEDNKTAVTRVTIEHDARDDAHNDQVAKEVADAARDCQEFRCQTGAPEPGIAGGKLDKGPDKPKRDLAAEKAKADPEAAKKKLDEVLKKDPENAAALSARALANAKMGNNNAACSDAKAALRGDPSDPGAQSISSLYCGPPKEVKKNAQDLLASLRGQSTPETIGAGRLGEASRTASAITTEARPRGGSDSRGASWKADEAAKDLRLGLYHDALAKAKEVLRLDPNNLQGHLLMAAAYKAMGNYKSALAAAEAGLKLDPGNLVLLNMKANALNHLKDHQSALSAAEEALRSNATDAASYVNKAYALGGQGDKEGMLAALRTAATLDPRYNASLQAAVKAIADGDDLFMLFDDSKRNSSPPPARRRSPLVRYGLMAIGALASLALITTLLPYFMSGPGTPVSTDGLELVAGQYEIKDNLGEGGMGVVYEAFDHNLQRKVAIKKMRPELKSRPDEWENFLREARTAAKLTHPYIVSIHDVFSENEEVYMVLDYVDGKPLSDLLAGGRRLPLEQIQSLFSHVCQAIDCAHRSRILHRDLKPGNIMIGADGYAKVMDFGLARQAKETLSKLTAQDTSGTPAYMAPEQHMGHAVAASDIYSLGVCLYECATGRRPFAGPDFLVQKERRLFKPVGDLVEGTPPALDRLISATLEPDPKKRVSDALEFEKALRGCLIAA